MSRGQEPAGDAKDRQFAATLAHGIDLLLCFRPGETVLANKELAERTGLSRPTVARLAHTLTLLGYLRQDDATRSYRLGAATVAISHPLLASMRIRPVARPLMAMLSREIEGAVSLGVRDRLHMVYVESARATDELITFPDIGAPLPMMATAIGRAWLAHAPADQRRGVMNQLRVADPLQFERHRPAIALAVKDLADTGFCSSRAEWRPEAHGFAVPLQGTVDGIQFVLNCGIPVSRGGFAALRRSVAPRLVSLARSLEVLLGLR